MRFGHYRTSVRGEPGVARLASEPLLDPQEFVVFGGAFGSGRRAGLDLPGIGGYRQMSDERILGLARAV